MSRPTFSLQPLEARRFLSATPTAVSDSPDVVEARQELQQVTLELRHDRYAGRAALFEIRAQIIEELQKLYASDKGDEVREALAPLYKDLRAALRAQGQARHDVLEDLQAVREKWAPTLKADVEAVWAAKLSGDDDALAEATKKIEADRKSLYDELNPLKDKLKEVTKETSVAIQNAHDAIEDKLGEFDDTLKDLFEKLRTKAKEVEQELIADTDAVMAAREKLRQALQDAGHSTADPALA
jgi:hypothetical protein